MGPPAPDLSYLSHEQCMSIWEKKPIEEMSRGQEGVEVSREDEDGERCRNIPQEEEAGRRSKDEDRGGVKSDQEEAGKNPGEGNLLLCALLSEDGEREESRNKEEEKVQEDREDQTHVHSIIESIETLLIMDDDKTFHQADPDMRETPTDFPDKGNNQEQQEVFLAVPKEMELELNPGTEKHQDTSLDGFKEQEAENVNIADGGKGAGEMKDEEAGSGRGEPDSGGEETMLVLAPGWKGEASCKRCNVFPTLINSEVWRKEGPR